MVAEPIGSPNISATRCGAAGNRKSGSWITYTVPRDRLPPASTPIKGERRNHEHIGRLTLRPRHADDPSRPAGRNVAGKLGQTLICHPIDGIGTAVPIERHAIVLRRQAPRRLIGERCTALLVHRDKPGHQPVAHLGQSRFAATQRGETTPKL
jgi:hypothetical protein